MYNLAFFSAFAVAALLVAWVVNGLVGLMSGERPRDTGRLWADVFLRIFMILELGVIERVLNYLGVSGGPRKLVFFIGLFCSSSSGGVTIAALGMFTLIHCRDNE